MKRGDIVTVYRRLSARHCIAFEAKVMAIVEGYAVVRRKGALPFLESVKGLEKWKTKPPYDVDVEKFDD